MTIVADSTTKNQHFVSRVEQQLNAANPGAQPKSQRIYEFEIVDRERHAARLINPRGSSIGATLSMFDLFSFDVAKDKAMRANFEAAFGRHESQVRANTERLLRAHAARSDAVSQEVFDLFVAKMMNFARNPYSVVKMLNTFGALAQIHPTNPTIYRSYERVLKGRKPQQAYLCKKLGISDDQYETWLRVLFMLLTPLAHDSRSMFEQALQTLFLQANRHVEIYVHAYNTERCLLSDRGLSSPIPEDKHLVFDFNLCANAFVRYAFLDYEALLGRPVPQPMLQHLARGPKRVLISYVTDDFSALDVFHRRVVEQCYARVFCSGATPYALTIAA